MNPFENELKRMYDWQMTFPGCTHKAAIDLAVSQFRDTMRTISIEWEEKMLKQGDNK